MQSATLNIGAHLTDEGFLEVSIVLGTMYYRFTENGAIALTTAINFALEQGRLNPRYRPNPDAIAMINDAFTNNLIPLELPTNGE